MASDGSIEFSTKLDNSTLESQLKEAEKRVKRLKSQLEAKTEARDAISAQLDEANASIERTKERVAELKARWEELSAAGDAGGAAAVGQELAAQNAQLDKQLDGVLALHDRWAEADAAVAEVAEGLQEASAEQARLQAAFSKLYKAKDGTLYASRMQAAHAKVAAAGRRAAKAVGDAYARAARVAQGAFAKVLPFATLSAGLYLMLGRMKDMALENERISRSVSALKAVCDGFASALLDAFAPAILAFLRVTTSMLMTLARLADSVLGTGFVAAIMQQARSASQAAEAEDRQARSTKRLAKAVKEANRQLMSFDELNVLAAEGSGDGADALDGMADGGVAGGGQAFDPSTLLQGVSDTLAKVMLLLGAALLAVGAILAFSGINVPLGIALMALGALMLYTAYKEQWDKLPGQVREAIGKTVVATGAVMLALGAVLAFSGANIPLGIGLMAAGLLLMGTAAALNWSELSQETREAIAGTLALAGAVALVVGAVLAFSGANVPLGIGLMAVGALALAESSALEPELVRGMVDEALGHVLALIGGMLIVLGVVLCVAGHLPLGIAFIIAGAAMFVGDAVLDWDKMSGKARAFMVGMLSVIASALVVLGLLLCVTGHPVLGIAAILAGILLFVSAAVLDDDDAPSRIRMFLSKMVPVIGKALVVVGVLLCVVGNLPLGIAAILFGILIWVTGETIVEGVPAGKIRGFIEQMMPAIGKAIVVIGVLLCLVGNLPLGIAAVALGVLVWVTGAAIDEKTTPAKFSAFIQRLIGYAGAGMLALGLLLLVFTGGSMLPVAFGLIVAGLGALSFSRANIDWGWLLAKVKSVWESIAEWWDRNVAQIFTWKWWSDKFKCIANGLISALNGALSGLGGFMGGFFEGIMNIANTVGFPFSYSFSVPKIPYLAQGAVIPPNREFMAVLGDQKRGRNLEAPEDLIRKIVREEAGGASAADMQRAFAAALMQVLPLFASRDGEAGDVVIELDGDVIARKVNAANAVMARRNILTS